MRFSSNMLLTTAVVIAVSAPAPATTVIGTLGNFDVVNSTGQTAYGFEIELEGISVSNVTDTFGGPGRGFPTSVERYGAPTIAPNAGHTGVIITYRANYDGANWNVSTPSGVFSTPGESCWSMGGIGYGASTPCDHFGVGTNANPTKTTYSWLLAGATPGTLVPEVATLPATTWVVTTPPPVPGSPPPPPHVVAQIKSPAPEGDAQFGTPQWVKVFSTEFDKPVALEDLMGGNGIVPQLPGEVEIEWQLLQTEAGNPLAGLLENEGDAGAGAEAVVRRYEFYSYTGAFNPDGEALCTAPDVAASSDCGNSPHFGLYGIGDLIGVQNGAVNLNGVYNGPPIGGFPAVPEPATWAMLLLGFFGTGAMMRYRRRSTLAA